MASTEGVSLPPAERITSPVRKPAFRSGTAGHNLHDLHASWHGDAEARRSRLGERYRLPGKSKVASHHAPFAHEIGYDALGCVDGDREAGRVRARDNRGIHADHAPPAIQKRSA